MKNNMKIHILVKDLKLESAIPSYAMAEEKTKTSIATPNKNIWTVLEKMKSIFMKNLFHDPPSTWGKNCSKIRIRVSLRTLHELDE